MFTSTPELPGPLTETPASDQMDVPSVAVHEAGHDLGLDHVANCTPVMGVVLDAQGFDTCDDYGVLDRTLQADDLAGLRFLYPYNSFSASVTSQTPLDSLILMIPGQRYPNDLAPVPFQATFRNTGRSPWGSWQDKNYPVRVGTTLPDNRPSPFCDSTWVGCNRPAQYSGGAVCNGSSITMSWYMKAPTAVGQYDEAFGALVENVAWLVKASPRWSDIVAQE